MTQQAKTLVIEDHSYKKESVRLLGKTKKQRQMFVVFVNNISYVIAEKNQIRNNTVENSMFNHK